jgi:hypothetical protein
MNTKNKLSNVKYTEDELMARLKFIIGLCLAITLMGIVFVVLYSIIFITQPLGAISPVDTKFFELIIPIATFLTGTLSGIMLAGNSKEARMRALEAATQPVVTKTESNFSNLYDTGRNETFPLRQEPSFGPAMSKAPVTNFKGRPGPVEEQHPLI